MSFKQQFHRLSDLVEASEDFQWERDWPLLLVFVVFTILAGPLWFFGWQIQHRNTTPVWDIEDHRDGTHHAAITFAGLALLVIAALLFLHPSLAPFWKLILWYGVCASFAPTFALVAEHLDPRTVSLQRVRLPSEQPPPPAPTPPVEEQQPVPPPVRKKRSSTTQKQTTTKKKGRAVPLGELLLQEKEEQAKQQPTALPDSNASPAPEPPPAAQKPERRAPESLDQLF